MLRFPQPSVNTKSWFATLDRNCLRYRRQFARQGLGSLDDLLQWLNTKLGIQGAMVNMRTKNVLRQFRRGRSFAVLLLLTPAIYPVPEAVRFQLSAPALPAGRLIDIEPQPGPQPPCGREPIPAYPGVDELAVVKSWSKSDLGRDWKPPTCTGWAEVGFTTLVTIAARFPHSSETDGLLRHIGAISELAGMRYWSTTHKQWRTLIVNAYALSNSMSGQRREDFTPNEMKEGKVLYFEQVDNLSGKAIYRMHIVEASASRLIFDIENVSTMRYYFIPVLHPGELQAMYFLDRKSDKVWRYFSIVRTGKNANGLIAGNESSSVNRAVAFYRYLVGIPPTEEPRGAR
jgi:hypothetical protein